MLQINNINDAAIIFTSRRQNCCRGPCMRNPRYTCCNPCPTSGQINMGSQGEGQKGYGNEQNYGKNTKINYGDQGKDQGGHGNIQTYRKREWMSETNQLD